MLITIAVDVIDNHQICRDLCIVYVYPDCYKARGVRGEQATEPVPPLSRDMGVRACSEVSLMKGGLEVVSHHLQRLPHE
jgi:hypothetical protein